MRYNDPSSQPFTGSVIGNTTDPAAATTAQFQAFWHELASRYVNNPKVIFGIMNEPHDMPTQLVLQNDQAAINGIRATGAKQLIIAPGNGFTGGHSWNQSAGGDAPSSEYLYMLKDPVKNTAIDIHEYLDYDYSGQHQVCNQSFPANLAYLTGWLQQHNLKAMITEFGGDNNTMCDNYLRQAVEYMAENDGTCFQYPLLYSKPLTNKKNRIHRLVRLGRRSSLGHRGSMLQRRRQLGFSRARLARSGRRTKSLLHRLAQGHPASAAKELAAQRYF